MFNSTTSQIENSSVHPSVVCRSIDQLIASINAKQYWIKRSSLASSLETAVNRQWRPIIADNRSALQVLLSSFFYTLSFFLFFPSLIFSPRSLSSSLWLSSFSYIILFSFYRVFRILELSLPHLVWLKLSAGPLLCCTPYIFFFFKQSTL